MSATKGSMARTAPPVRPQVVPVASLSMVEKITKALIRALEKVADETGQLLSSGPSMTTMAITAGTAAVVMAGLVAAYFFPPSGVVLAIFTAAGAIATGGTALWAAWYTAQALWILKSATTEEEIEEAAELFKEAMILVGPDLFLAAFTAGTGLVAKKAIQMTNMALKAGMPITHFTHMSEVASQMNRLVIVRNTKEAAIKWIQLGYSAKPRWLSIKSDAVTGIVAADLSKAFRFRDPDLLADAQRMATIGDSATVTDQLHRALALGDYVVDSDGVARNLAGEVFRGATEWGLAPGQIINKVTKKPYVGDYDLLDVIDMDNIAKQGDFIRENYAFGIENVTTADMTEFIRRINAKLGFVDQRAMHAGWAAYDYVGKAGDCTLFFPDGSVVQMTQLQVAQFYRDWGRAFVFKGK